LSALPRPATDFAVAVVAAIDGRLRAVAEQRMQTFCSRSRAAAAPGVFPRPTATTTVASSIRGRATPIWRSIGRAM
jgi:hypothetical protein